MICRRCPRMRIGLLLGLLGLQGLALPTPARGASSGIAVVVNPAVPVQNLKLSDLRKVLLGDRQFWAPNLRVTLLMLAPGARERDVVLRKVYEMTEPQFRQYWIAKVFRAEVATGPKIVSTSRASTGLTASIPGAISFVSADDVPRNLRILRIDGRLPGDRGYPLQ